MADMTAGYKKREQFILLPSCYIQFLFVFLAFIAVLFLLTF